MAHPLTTEDAAAVLTTLSDAAKNCRTKIEKCEKLTNNKEATMKHILVNRYLKHFTNQLKFKNTV